MSSFPLPDGTWAQQAAGVAFQIFILVTTQVVGPRSSACSSSVLLGVPPAPGAIKITPLPVLSPVMIAVIPAVVSVTQRSVDEVSDKPMCGMDWIYSDYGLSGGRIPAAFSVGSPPASPKNMRRCALAAAPAWRWPKYPRQRPTRAVL